MYQLVYASRATVPFSSEQLLALLQKSRTKNSLQGISGMLLYQAGNFVQVLEGEEAAVCEVAARIAQDPRHTNMVIVHEASSMKRDFPDWSMAFHHVDAQSLRQVGFSRFMESALSAAHFANNPPEAKRLLMAFRDLSAPPSPAHAVGE